MTDQTQQKIRNTTPEEDIRVLFVGTQHCALVAGHDGRHGEGISSWPRAEAGR